MKQGLVSVITPCYNAEKYISKLLDSVLSQTYKDIEMILVDDGSTDKSAEIIKSYVPKFKKRGYHLNYVYQDNQGQSVAINNALKMVKGEYLVWPDADDYYANKSSIDKMVNILDDSDDDVGMVRVEYSIIDTEGKAIRQHEVNDLTRYKTDLFEDAVFGENGFWYPPGGYMAKVSKIDQLIPGRSIYTERQAGQNYQLYLPLLYCNKIITIPEKLYSIVSHPDSHSRTKRTFSERQNIYLRTINNTLDRMTIETEYRKFLYSKVKKILSDKKQAKQGRRYRTGLKRAVKSILPYGVVMLYKRRKK